MNQLQAQNANFGYSRENPSPEYIRLVALYNELHQNGNARDRGKDIYPGKSLYPYVGFIKALTEKYGAASILDYGSGKGLQYTDVRPKVSKGPIFRSIPEYWGVNVSCYDPGNAAFNQMPGGVFDGVVSTDVLEHCPKPDIDWILHEMFGKAKKFVFANIACYPAATILPNGENAHSIIENPSWWRSVIEGVAKDYPAIDYYFVATVRKKEEATLITNAKKPDTIPAVGVLPGNLLKAYIALFAQRLNLS